MNNVLKRAGSLSDSPFRIVPKGCTCFLIWRIENLQVVPVPPDQYGCFFDADSYLVLAAVPANDQSNFSITQVKEAKGNLDVRIHLWLGENTYQEEAGAAASKAIELEEYLGGTPVQYREVQGQESKIFLNYFRKICGVRYSPGGYLTGLLHIDQIVKPRLLHVMGKHYSQIFEVPISWISINSNSVYILDIGQVLFIWSGKLCSRTETIKAMEYARKLRDDRGRGNIVIVEDGEEDVEHLGDDVYRLLEEYLPKSDKPLHNSSSHHVNGSTNGTKTVQHLKLWQCSEEGSQLKLTEISQSPLMKDMLEANFCYIVDNGEAGVWTWCGRNASKQEKQEATTNAIAFAVQRKYSAHVQITKVHQGAEPAEFKLLFSVWEKEKVLGRGKSTEKRISKIVQTKIDAATMHDQPQVAKETGMVDDGTGTKKIWRIERREDTYNLVELEKKFIGQLYGGDSYVILYKYIHLSKDHHIIYYWLGQKSSQAEMNIAARKAMELDESLGGSAKIVRVVQGKEPNHFLAIFNGRLVVFEGGKAGLGNQQEEGPGDTYLLHVQGTTAYNTKAEQVRCHAESLNSNDVFVLFSKMGVFVWAGKGCTGDEREMGKQIASVSPRGYNMMTEGQEKIEFWNVLGGKAEYATPSRSQVECETKQRRLFRSSFKSGHFSFDQILFFSQQDLLLEDVYLLDSHDSIFVWLGQDAPSEEKTTAIDAAMDFLLTDSTGRDHRIPIYVIKQELEPPDFIGHFPDWNRKLSTERKSYEQLKKELCERNVFLEPDSNRNNSNGVVSFSELAKYSFDILTNKDKWPEGLDLQHKEKHLSSEEFQQIFGMTYAEFVNLPIWKQQQLKKTNQLW